MSDLAPFVAAVLRDKVVVDLQEENNRLKKELRNEIERNEKKKEAFFISNALSGVKTLYIAVTGPNPEDRGEKPVVYAVNRVDHKSHFTIIVNKCTLGDLPNAQICINGHSKTPLESEEMCVSNNIPPKCEKTKISMSEITGETLEDLGLVSFCISFIYDIGVLYFDLKDISLEKWLQFIGLDCDEYIKNPWELSVESRRFKISELIAIFGSETVVGLDIIPDKDYVNGYSTVNFLI